MQKEFENAAGLRSKMEYSEKDINWETLSHEQKNHILYLKQKELLDQFLEKGAITRAQHDKSLKDLTEKMGETAEK